MAGQQGQQVAVWLDLDLLRLVGLDDLNARYGVGQRFPQVGELHGIAHLQAVDVTEVVRAAPATVSGNDAVGVVAANGR